MGLDQVSTEYSQEFIGKHAGHMVLLSIVQLVEARYSATIENGMVVAEELEQKESVQDVGFHLHCHDCGIEQEINMSDVDYE